MRQISLVLLTLTLVTFSCKKGEEDPFLSLRSRKNRITNDWKIQTLITYNKNEFSNNGPQQVQSSHFRLTDNNVVLQEINPSSTTTTTNGKSSTHSWIIKKDYTWERSISYEFTKSGILITKESTENGTWHFGRKSSDSKNKQHIIFQLTSLKGSTIKKDLSNGLIISNQAVDEEYSNGSKYEKYEIIGLANKKVHLYSKSTNNVSVQSVSILSTRNKYSEIDVFLIQN